MKTLRFAVLTVAVVVVVLAALLGQTWRARRASVGDDMSAEEIIALAQDETGDASPPAQDPQPPSHIADEPDTSPATAALLTQLPTREQRVQHLARLQGMGKLQGAKKAITHVYLSALKTYDSVVWLTDPEYADRFAPDIAWHSARTGDLETARRFMRRALQVETDPAVRRYICGQLAWLEDDPKVAAALLESSCEVDTFLELRNAIDFAHTTGNTALEQHYRARQSIDDRDVVIYNGPVGAL